MSLADHIIVMHLGRVVQQDSPAAIYRTPNSRLVAEFIGRTNWFEGRVNARQGRPHLFESAEGSFIVADGAAFDGQACHLCVRPERLRILCGDAAPAPENVLSGKLAAVAHLGAEIHYILETASGRTVLLIEQNRDQAIPGVGTALRVGFRAADVILTPLEEARGE